MQECIFCKIVSGEFKSAKIWENEEFLSILDAFPNTNGMALVLTKKHYNSDIFGMPPDFYQRYLLAGQKVAHLLEK